MERIALFRRKPRQNEMSIRRFEANRAVEIKTSSSYGTGYRIGGHLVLTVAHLFAENGIGSPVDFRLWDSKDGWESDAHVVWCAPNADAALVQLPERILPVEPCEFGRISAEHGPATIRFEFYGWPEWAQTITEKGSRQAGGRHIEGTIHVNDRSPDGYIVLEPDRAPWQREKGERGSPWQGTSGAAVLCEGFVVAIQRWHQRPDRTNSLEAVPVERLLHDEQFVAIISQHGISPQPVVVDQHASTKNSHDLDPPTPQVRQAYLHWLKSRCVYLDQRSAAFQPYYDTPIELDTIHVPLVLTKEIEPSKEDRRLSEAELEQLLKSGKRDLTRLEVRDELWDQVRMRVQKQKAIDRSSNPLLEFPKVLNDNPYLVVIGDPGSGKTTLLRHLALQLASALLRNTSFIRVIGSRDSSVSEVTNFPILMRIADYAELDRWCKHPLGEFLAMACILSECPHKGLANLFAHELEQGRCLILLDGLDEIVEPGVRLGIVRRIEDFVHRFGSGGQRGKNRIVVTSRIAGYRAAPLTQPFVCYAIQELSEQQIQRFLENWFGVLRATDKHRADGSPHQIETKREIERMMTMIQENNGVSRLATNPLLLQLLVMLHRSGKPLPEKRVELYQLVAQTLATTWRTAQGMVVNQLMEEPYLTSLLCKAAYWIHQHKSTGLLTADEVFEVLGKEWARIRQLDFEQQREKVASEVSAFLVFVREQTGLFVERAPRRYGFMHLCVEEYYAACYLVATPDNLAWSIRQHLHNPRWQEPILLTLALVALNDEEGAGQLVETAILAQGSQAERLGIAASNYEQILGRDFLFAVRCLGNGIPLRHAVADQLIARMENELVRRVNMGRYDAYWGRLKQLLPGLDRTLWGMRLLHAFLLNSSSSNQFKTDSGGVSHLNYSATVLLVSFLHNLQHFAPHAREVIFSTLGTITIPAEFEMRSEHERRSDCADILVGLLSKISHSDSDVYEDGVTLLLNLSLQIASNRYTQSESEDRRRIRLRLEEALLAKDLRLSRLQRRLLAEIWTAVVKDPDNAVQGQVLSVLKTSRSVLIRHLARALNEYGLFVNLDQLYLEQLTNKSHSQDMNSRHWAWQELVKLGLGERAINLLTTALYDNDYYVAAQAAESLAELASESQLAVQSLIGALDDWQNNRELDVGGSLSTHAAVRSWAVEGLGKASAPSDEIVRILKVALSDPNINVRCHAAIALNHLKVLHLSVLDVFIDALVADDLRTRRQAVRYALNIIESISSTDKYFRVYSFANLSTDEFRADQWLKEIDDKGDATVARIIDALLVRLSDEDEAVRIAAARALVQLNKDLPSLADHLLQLLQSPSANVREDAAAMIGQLVQANSAITDALLAVSQNDVDAKVRSRAIASLAMLNSPTPEVLHSLLGLAKDPDVQVRREVIEALTVMYRATNEVLNVLSAALKDDASARDKAIQGLLYLSYSSASATKMLIEALADDKLAIYLLPEPKFLGKIINLVEAANKGAQVLNEVLFGERKHKLPESSYIDLANRSFKTQIALTKLLLDQKRSVELQLMAAWTLSELDSPSSNVIDALTVTLESPNDQLRFGAIVALGKLGSTSPAFEEAVLRTLTDSDSKIRSELLDSPYLLRVSSAGNVKQLIDQLLRIARDKDTFHNDVYSDILNNKASQANQAIQVLAKLGKQTLQFRAQVGREISHLMEKEMEAPKDSLPEWFNFADHTIVDDELGAERRYSTLSRRRRTIVDDELGAERYVKSLWFHSASTFFDHLFEALWQLGESE